MTMQVDSLELLEGLIHHYSPSGKEHLAVRYLAREMQSLGYEVEIDEVGNVIGTIGSGEREVMLLGHIDTVPGVIPVTRRNGTLWGRGSVDAKGPLAAFTSAAAQAGERDGWRFTVIGAVGEEAESHGAKNLLDRKAPELLIIGEPSNWERITLGYLGSLWMEVTARSDMAHTAANNMNANESAIQFWNRLKAAVDSLNRGQEKIFEQVHPTLKAIHSENGEFQEKACMSINLRIPMGFSRTEAESLISSIQRDEEVEILEMIPAYRGDKNNALVRAFLNAIRYNEGKPRFAFKTGTSDMNITAPVWNCPVVAYGPGDASLDHTPNEHLSLEEYQRSIAVLANVLQNLN